MEEHGEGTQSVMLSRYSHMLCVELPCGCKLTGGLMHYCGKNCDWFQWSAGELDRAGTHVLKNIALQSSQLLDAYTGGAPAFKEYDDEATSAEVFIPASDFASWLDLEMKHLGQLRPRVM